MRRGAGQQYIASEYCEFSGKDEIAKVTEAFTVASKRDMFFEGKGTGRVAICD
jgi:hypothetical protein